MIVTLALAAVLSVSAADELNPPAHAAGSAQVARWRAHHEGAIPDGCLSEVSIAAGQPVRLNDPTWRRTMTDTAEDLAFTAGERVWIEDDFIASVETLEAEQRAAAEDGALPRIAYRRAHAQRQVWLDDHLDGLVDLYLAAPSSCEIFVGLLDNPSLYRARYAASLLEGDQLPRLGEEWPTYSRP